MQRLPSSSRLLAVLITLLPVADQPNACRGATEPEPAELTRQITLNHRYLNVPVKADAPRRTISVIVGDRVVRGFEVELATGKPDFWAFTDLGEWRGKPATLKIDLVGLLDTSESQTFARAHPLAERDLDSLRLEDEIVDAASLYREPLRPQFHFTTRRGWLNDPHGPIYYQGEYHLFYQLQPFNMNKPMTSNKCWGHAVSRDLVHWEERPVALYPDQNGSIWSGSAMIDWHNTAGLQRGPDPALLAFYTAGTGRSVMSPHPGTAGNFVQSLAFSNDRGRTWARYSGNPVLKTVTPYNRDPLVFWHAPSKRWVMMLYVGYPVSNPGNHPTAQIFNSENLRDWTYQSRLDGFFDGPVIFELPLDGNAADTRWIVHCANMKYQVGRFDGRKFTPETGLIDSHLGKTEESAYAASMAVNVPGDRHIQMAWLYHKAVGPGIRQMMTFPSEIELVTTEAGPRLQWQPIREIESLYGATAVAHELPLRSGESPQVWAAAPQLEIRARLRMGTARQVTINLRGIPVTVDAAAKRILVHGYSLPIALKQESLDLRLLLDSTSLELFAESGRVYLPLALTVPASEKTVTMAASGGEAVATSFAVIELKSAWR